MRACEDSYVDLAPHECRPFSEWTIAKPSQILVFMCTIHKFKRLVNDFILTRSYAKLSNGLWKSCCEFQFNGLAFALCAWKFIGTEVFTPHAHWMNSLMCLLKLNETWFQCQDHSLRRCNDSRFSMRNRNGMLLPLCIFIFNIASHCIHTILPFTTHGIR